MNVEQLEQELYIYLLKVESLLKTIKNNRQQGEQIQQFEQIFFELKDMYNKLVETADKNEKNNLLKQTLELLETLHDHIMNVHCNELAIINEKADVQIETTKLIEKFKD